MDTQYGEPLIIGCHHKTGTEFLSNVLPILADQLWSRDYIIIGKSATRKLPLSQVLKSIRNDFRCYLNIWFEHEVDLPQTSVRFVHFIRDPIKWIRSAYLYHKKGGPSEGSRWLDWRVFRIGDRQLSYCELLNSVREEIGILIEAVRSFPEVAGTARASYSSNHLTMKKNMTLEQLQSEFDDNVISLCQFVGLNSTKINLVMDVIRKHDLSRMAPLAMPAHVTRGTDAADRLESYLIKDAGFMRLYTDIAGQMGFTIKRHWTQPMGSLLSDSFIDRILSARDFLLAGDFSTEMKQHLCADVPGTGWLAYALQSFGQGGHLMMYEFIQEMMRESDMQAGIISEAPLRGVS
jgi:hypothetical protein